jgi:uncharacterized protein YcbX
MVLSRIDLFPIKSLDGISVASARINCAGILEHDRVYAIVDAAGSYRFNHCYRFAVNTSIPSSEAGKLLRAGDTVLL